MPSDHGPWQGRESEAFADDLPDAHARIERRVRVLEDDLHLAAHLAHRRRVQRQQLAPLEGDAAAGRLDEPDKAAPERRLAATRFADQPNRLAVVNVETDAVDRLDLFAPVPEHPGPHREIFLQVADLEQRHLGNLEAGDVMTRLDLNQ